MKFAALSQNKAQCQCEVRTISFFLQKATMFEIRAFIKSGLKSTQMTHCHQIPSRTIYKHPKQAYLAIIWAYEAHRYKKLSTLSPIL